MHQMKSFTRIRIDQDLLHPKVILVDEGLGGFIQVFRLFHFKVPTDNPTLFRPRPWGWVGHRSFYRYRLCEPVMDDIFDNVVRGLSKLGVFPQQDRGFDSILAFFLILKAMPTGIAEVGVLGAIHITSNSPVKRVGLLDSVVIGVCRVSFRNGMNSCLTVCAKRRYGQCRIP